MIASLTMVILCESVLVSACFHTPGPFGFNDKVEVRVEFSLPIATPSVDEPPALELVIGSVSTAKTSTYLTGFAVHSTNMSANASLYDYSSLFLEYVVGADDESHDLRWASLKHLEPDLEMLCTARLEEAPDNQLLARSTQREAPWASFVYATRGHLHVVVDGHYDTRTASHNSFVSSKINIRAPLHRGCRLYQARP